MMGGGGLLSDDIWKPGSDLFAGSFTIDNFYEPPSVMEGEPVEAVNLDGEKFAVEQQPSIAEEDSAIKTVIYSQELPVQPQPVQPHHPQPPVLPQHVQPQPVQSQHMPIPVQLQDVLPQHVQPHPVEPSANVSAAMSTWEDSLSHLSNEYNYSTMSLGQSHIAHDTNIAPLMVNIPALPANMQADSGSHVSDKCSSPDQGCETVEKEDAVTEMLAASTKLNKGE